MDLRLKDRVVLVTGGSSGIGLATVDRLLREGARVATCARDPRRLASALAPLGASHPGRLVWHTADVLDQVGVEQFIDHVVGEWGPVHGVVNNAGGSLVSTFASTTAPQWRHEFDLKVLSVVNVLTAVHDALVEGAAARGGAVVNINAVLARQPEPHLVATAAARAALLNLSRSLAEELAPSRVRVNSVLVGLIDTGQWARRHAESGDSLPYEEWAAAIAADRGASIRRFGTAAEVADTISFLLSPRAGYITGATIDVAGGVPRYV